VDFGLDRQGGFGRYLLAQPVEPAA
jgi:hypothetical protein